MEKITIFTPTYNRAHTLTRTYESLCQQTCKDFEWMVIDDGSTDKTELIVRQWKAEQKIPIRYIKKENGGLYTCYNIAYQTISTPLCTCIDSDDYMPTNAVEEILRHWERYGGDSYAGMIGLDLDITTMLPIGGLFPQDLKVCHYYDLYARGIHKGDSKAVMRTDLMREVAPMVGFAGEKNFNPIYMMLQVCDEKPVMLLNKPLCIVEYQQTDSMSRNIYHQYFDSPKSFSKLRKLEMTLKRNTLANLLRVTTHYIATSIISKDRAMIKQSPRPVLTSCLLPAGLALYLYLKLKTRK